MESAPRSTEYRQSVESAARRGVLSAANQRCLARGDEPPARNHGACDAGGSQACAVLRRITVRLRRDEERRPKQPSGGRASRQHRATGRRVREGASKAFSSTGADQRRSSASARTTGCTQTMKTLCRSGTVAPFFTGEQGNAAQQEPIKRIVISKPKTSAPPSASGNAAPADQ